MMSKNKLVIFVSTIDIDVCYPLSETQRSKNVFKVL